MGFFLSLDFEEKEEKKHFESVKRLN